MAPSALGPAERGVWAGLLAATPHLQRGFFTHGFAAACEAAGFRARVALLHEGGRIRAILPFQYRSRWHQLCGLGERIGGSMSDHAGLVAEPGFRIEPHRLLRLCGLGGLYMTHLTAAQPGYGLAGEGWRIGHRIDLAEGSAAYFAALSAERKPFVNDTGRRLRRAAKDYGPVAFTAAARPAEAEAMAVVEWKRAQYARTGAADSFADPRRVALLRHLAAAPAEDCPLLLTVLRAGERVLARHVGLLHAGVLSYWFPVYDPEAQKVSPGRLLLWHTIEAADGLGIRLIDRGEGDSESKRDFSTGTAQFGEAYFGSGTPGGGVARLLQATEWRLNLRWGAA